MPTSKNNLPSRPGVYEITCAANGKTYVGSSYNMKARISRHMRMLHIGNHPNPPMQAAFDCYGGEAFGFTVLEECDKSVLLLLEQKYINITRNLFNISLFAGAPNRGRTFSPEVRAKVSRSLMGNQRTLGYKHTAETRAAMSARLKGRRVMPEGWKPSPEQRAKIVISSTGRFHSDDSKKKLSDIKKQWWAERKAGS